MNQIEMTEKNWITTKAYQNASAITSEGSSKRLDNCVIDIPNVITLRDYIAEKERKENAFQLDGEDVSLYEDEKLSKVYVLPVLLPDGQQVKVIVNQKGQDMACVFEDEEGNISTFTLTPRMKKEITAVGIESKDIRVLDALYPETLNAFAEEISKDTLIPKTQEKAIEKINHKMPDAKVNVPNEEVKQEVEQNEEIPEEIRDKIATICSENPDCHIEDLKQIIYVRNPNSITDKIENTGLNYERGEVVCLRFKGKEISGNDRIMMLQGDRTIDKREYDADMSVLMDKEYPKEKIDNLEDKNMKISYTDLDNHTYISEIQREPRDLTLMQKQIMLKELETINQNEKKIWNSDLPIEDKAREMIKINNKRIEVFKKYGISVPNIELEIKADNDISKKVLEDNKNVDDDADGRDPRDPIEILNHR